MFLFVTKENKNETTFTSKCDVIHVVNPHSRYHFWASSLLSASYYCYFTILRILD